MENKKLIEFIQKSNLKYNFKFDYSKIILNNSKSKIIIICNVLDENNKIHGEFEQRADMHLFGQGCPKCNKQNLSTKEFIIRSNKKHHNKYDYSKSKYINSQSKIIIICNVLDENNKIHGEFEQIPANHIFGTGCPKCSKNQKLTLSEFVEKANQIHQNKFDYSLIENIGSNKDKQFIICNEHGKFEQRLDMHLFGEGCPKCAKVQKLTNENFIERANIVHQNFYAYHKIDYQNMYTNIWIHCSILDNDGNSHGDFQQTPTNHLNGKGCPKCAIQNSCSTTEEFIKISRKVHGYKYNYSKVDYVHSKQKVIIICNKHGEFEQLPNGHLTGNGCFQCAIESSSSKAEKEIFEFLNVSNFKLIENDRNVLNGKELDIYIPEKNLAIEFNGLYWHSELKKSNNYHLEKTKECESKGIQLIQIFEDEWVEKQEIVKSRLINLFGLNQQKIYARKCKILEVSVEDTRKFLETNHIQGFVGSKYSYGLYYQNSLVSLMIFGYLRKNLGSNDFDDNSYELLRFCNKINTSVIGGASKLFKYFVKFNQPKKIISYADRRWSQGKLYETLGFTFSHNSVPNYFYIFGQTRKNRFNFRKDILISKYGCKQEDTEHNFCFNQGWYRIYDCGTKAYTYNGTY